MTATATQPSRTQTAKASGAQEGLAESLADALEGLVHEHERLVGLLRLQRASMRSADAPGLQENLVAQQACVAQIRALDAQRRSSMPRGAETIADATASLPPTIRPRLESAAHRLRQAIEHVQIESRVAKTAAGSISDHLDALMRRVAERLSHDKTYARQGKGGRVTTGSAPVVTHLDITS